MPTKPYCLPLRPPGPVRVPSVWFVLLAVVQFLGAAHVLAGAVQGVGPVVEHGVEAVPVGLGQRGDPVHARRDLHVPELRGVAQVDQTGHQACNPVSRY